jgi:hypothetical protein
MSAPGPLLPRANGLAFAASGESCRVHLFSKPPKPSFHWRDMHGSEKVRPDKPSSLPFSGVRRRRFAARTASQSDIGGSSADHACELSPQVGLADVGLLRC